MRITIDLPDELLRRAKATAAMRGMKVKELIAGCLEVGLSHAPHAAATGSRPKRSAPPMIASAMTGNPISSLTKDEIAEVEMEEDLEKLRRSFGR